MITVVSPRSIHRCGDLEESQAQESGLDTRGMGLGGKRGGVISCRASVERLHYDGTLKHFSLFQADDVSVWQTKLQAEYHPSPLLESRYHTSLSGS